VVADLKSTQEQVIRQERLGALGQMASGIAHDFNNALTPILGYSQILIQQLEDKPDMERAIHNLQTMMTAAMDATNIVSRLREFYRHRDPSECMLAVDFNAIIKETITLTQPKWKDQAQSTGISVNIVTEFEEDLPPVMGNETELREVLINLILNAVDAMPEGGILSLCTKSNGKSIIIEISDTGIGMSDDICKRCMDPFFSTKGDQGTGLGLASVHGIIRRHEGTVNISSKPGRGTTFIIFFPIKEVPKEPTEKKRHNEIPPGLHILVIDDEPMVVNFLKDFLTNNRHVVETATNGHEAISKYKSQKFDLVVTDKAMPGISGDMLAASLKDISPETPIILLTGFGKIMQDSGEKPDYVDMVVGKPIMLNDFKEAILSVLP
jgi:CheY-like chemotaxis protein/anti-sigma regulatory factor (Ser/Thr protein kinase)